MRKPGGGERGEEGKRERERALPMDSWLIGSVL